MSTSAGCSSGGHPVQDVPPPHRCSPVWLTAGPQGVSLTISLSPSLFLSLPIYQLLTEDFVCIDYDSKNVITIAGSFRGGHPVQDVTPPHRSPPVWLRLVYRRHSHHQLCGAVAVTVSKTSRYLIPAHQCGSDWSTEDTAVTVSTTSRQLIPAHQCGFPGVMQWRSPCPSRPVSSSLPTSVVFPV